MHEAKEEAMSVDEIEQAAETEQSPADLATVSRLANRQLVLQQEIESLEKRLKDKKEEFRHVSQVDLPAALDSVGLASVELADGQKVTIEEGVDARLPKDRKGEALRWLEEHGFEHMIKREVKATLGRDPEAAKQAAEALRQLGIEPEDAETVHPQTLKAWARERLREGDEVPEDLFGLYEYRVAKIK